MDSDLHADFKRVENIDQPEKSGGREERVVKGFDSKSGQRIVARHSMCWLGRVTKK